jgi:hypothetical protein
MRFLLAAFLLASSTAYAADVNLDFGTKWVPLSYTKPISVKSTPAGTSGTGGGPDNPVPLYGWNTTSLNNHMGAFFLDGKLGALLSFDLGWGSVDSSSTNAAVATQTQMSFKQFGLGIGGKYYFLAPRRERVTPYVFADFYKYWAAVSTNDKGIPNDQAGYVAGLASPIGFDLAGGVEYFFTPGFSIGAELIGLRYAYAQGDYRVMDTQVETKQQYFTLYTGITLNYRFAVGRKATPPAAPAVQTLGSPEAVD